MKNEIIPVILAKDLTDFKSKLAIIKALRPKPRWVQIDVVDGKFAPWKTWPLNPLRLPLNLRGRDCCIEVDLMVVDPLKHAKAWIKAGAKRILIHVEALPRYTEIQSPKFRRLDLPTSIEIGLSLNAQTPLSHLTPYIKYADCVLLLGVNPGKSGQPFQPQVLKKIRVLRKKYPALPIEVDGGVNLKNAETILKAGATRLAAASAILNSPNPQKTYKEFLNIMDKVNR